MPINDFAIDDVTMTNQPSDVNVEPRDANYIENDDGGFLASIPSKGDIVIVTFGVTGMLTAAIAELRTKRGSTFSHKLTWTDLNSVAQTFEVFIPPIGHHITSGEYYAPLVLRCRERAS